MNFAEYLETYDAQKKIDKLSKRYKNKKVAIYGAGQFAQILFEKYDLSSLNIVAVADMKFKDENKRKFFGLNCIPSDDLGIVDCDVILIANFDYAFFLTQLDDKILYRTKNENVEVRPLIKLTFRDLYLK